MKLGMVIAGIIINIFRYSAKPEMRQFPWRPLFVKIHQMSVSRPSFPANTLISVVLTCLPSSLSLTHATLPLIRRCHSNKNEYTTFVENPKKSLRPIEGLAAG